MHSILESEWLRNGLQGCLHRVFLYSSDLRTATRSVTVALYHGPTNVWNFCLCTAGLAILFFLQRCFYYKKLLPPPPMFCDAQGLLLLLCVTAAGDDANTLLP